MAYRYELHCHTSDGSKCSDISIKEMFKLYQEIGYTGVCITDHFTNPMNPLPDDSPWSERVNLSFDIYQKALEEGKKYGMSVFFGIEYSIAPDIDHPSQATCNDFIFLNLEKEWLMEHKDAFREKTEGLFHKVHDAGGFIIHAHPMFGGELRLFPYCVDAVEIINGGANSICNENAKTYANMYGLTGTGGTDLHRYDQKLMSGVETEKRCSTIEELINEIKERRAKPFSLTRQISDYWQQIQYEASEARKKSTNTL